MNCRRQLAEIGSVRKRVAHKKKEKLSAAAHLKGNVSAAATLR